MLGSEVLKLKMVLKLFERPFKLSSVWVSEHGGGGMVRNLKAVLLILLALIFAGEIKCRRSNVYVFMVAL